MCTLLKNGSLSHRISLSRYTNLIERCLTLKSVAFSESVHAKLIRAGFNRHTFLGNRCLDLYTKLARARDVLKVFEEIDEKNTISWNICLKGLIKAGQVSRARELFDKIPERDVVSWNSMISGFSSHGFVDSAMKCFFDMQNSGVKPSMHTLSNLMSFALTPYQAKEIHGRTIRNGIFTSNVVIGNSLIDMYGRFGLVNYAFGVFWNMEELDVISWNSLISGCSKAGCHELALEQFYLMRYSGYSIDGYTLSLIMTICSDFCHLEQGEKLFACGVKLGHLFNSVVSSAAIDLFSKCGRLEDSIKIFAELSVWNSVVCNSMIASYVRQNFHDEAMKLFALSLRKNILPTEFTISNVLCCTSDLLPMTPGLQVHSLAVKFGFDSDVVVTSSLVDMYAKYGMVDSSFSIFLDMGVRDLLCWNTMINGLTRNGRILGALSIFKEMLGCGVHPDRISFNGVLAACNFSDLVTEGLSIFSAMENEYGITPRDEHYDCVVGLMCRAGRLTEAIEVIERMPNARSSSVWNSLLSNIQGTENLRLVEKVSYKMKETNPHAYLPYLALSQAYEKSARWDSLARVKKAMKEIGFRKEKGRSWVGIRNCGFVFDSDELLHHGGVSVYLVLRLVSWEMQDEGYQATELD